MRAAALSALLLAFLLVASGCPPSDVTKKKASGPNWRQAQNGVQVFMGQPPQGIKRTIGTVYAQGHTESDAITALTSEALRLRADAIYAVRESDLPGRARQRGTGPTVDPRTGLLQPGNYESETHIKTWQAIAVILEPVSPTDRIADEEGDEDETVEDENAEPTPEPVNPKDDD